jgi:two-component system sensor histidine kinase KdpD
VHVDPVLLERAVANLLANAFRYSPPDRPVTVRAMAADGAGVELRVEDGGPGIPRTERARVFQPFQRLDDSPEAAGVGLGLAVARGFVTAMDGTVAVDETPGGGTTIVVSLPTDTPARAAGSGEV